MVIPWLTTKSIAPPWRSIFRAMEGKTIQDSTAQHFPALSPSWLYPLGQCHWQFPQKNMVEAWCPLIRTRRRLKGLHRTCPQSYRNTTPESAYPGNKVFSQDPQFSLGNGNGLYCRPLGHWKLLIEVQTRILELPRPVRLNPFFSTLVRAYLPSPECDRWYWTWSYRDAKYRVLFLSSSFLLYSSIIPIKSKKTLSRRTFVNRFFKLPNMEEQIFMR